MNERSLRIGIDVGGTNTDAVAIDEADRVVAKAKRPTSPDVTEGLRAALDAVLAELPDPRLVARVMLGTTHATNAILERRALGRVAVLRLGAPATTSVPPLSEWPDDLRETVAAGTAVIRGGHFVDGREIAPLDLDAVKRFLNEEVRADAVAITGVFSPADADHENRVAEVVRSELGDVPVSLSHEIGSLGLLERENATILNAALYGVARDVTIALQDALSVRGLVVETFFAQNDGTLMSVDYAARYPVLTIGSGPANSLRGAAYLSGVRDAIVADVGGTSTDIGVLAGGFPRESAAAVEIGGITTNFRMPDILSIALGGGTIVGRGSVPFSGRSVGYRIGAEALVFGGRTATMTDAAVAAGRGEVGTHPVPEEWLGHLAGAVRAADELVADAVDRVSLGRSGSGRSNSDRGDRPLVAVGGGAFLLAAEVPGAGEVLRPEHAEVANAVGAAIALASGRIETIIPTGGEGNTRARLIEKAKEEAAARAVAAGADSALVQIVELSEIPLSYLSEPAVRLQVKAAGPLAR